jgi:CheY-like chemotaxis protein
MHGGTVTAESAGQGKGSTFTVLLPAMTTLPDPPPTARPDDWRASRVKRRILVVDDNRDSARTMARLLKLIGDDVRTAHDGVEAVEVAEDFRPEVILMDVGMPRMDGFEAARQIRDRPWGRGVTILALTGWGQEGDRLQSQAAGCDGHLVKPVNLDDLESLLGALTGSRRTEPPGAPSERERTTR